jgi:thioredoxin-like negative regulator of GroEL
MIEVTEDTFSEKLLGNSKTVVTLFYTTYCPYVKKFWPIFEKYSQNSNIEYAITDITDDDNPLWDKYKVTEVPTIVAFKEGREISRRNATPGFGLTEDDMLDLLDEI